MIAGSTINPAYSSSAGPTKMNEAHADLVAPLPVMPDHYTRKGTPSRDHGVGRNWGTVCDSIDGASVEGALPARRDKASTSLLTDGVRLFFHPRALRFHAGRRLVAAGDLGDLLENLG